MSSVASDPNLFQPVKPVTPVRHDAAHESERSNDGAFAKLLDDEPREPAPAPHAKRNDAKTQRRDDTAPADKAPQDDDASAARSSKSPNPDESADAAAAQSDAIKPDAKSDVTETADKPAGEAAETKVADAVEIALFDVPAVETPVAAAAPAVATVPAGSVPPNLPTDPAIVPAAPQGADAPVDAAPQVAAPAAAGPAAPAAAQPGGADAAAGETSTAPALPGVAKAQQPAAAIAEQPGTDAPAAAQSKSVAPKPDGVVPNPAPARAEQQAEVPARPVPQRASTPGETPVDATTARPQDSAAIAKTGAELAQSLGFTAPAQHGAPMQSTAAAHAAAAAAPAPAPTPAVPIANVAFEIAAQSLAGKNRFEIRLDPPELGRIDVRLEIDQDGHVKSRLIVERAETLDMLRRDAPQLERALQQAGLKTSDNALEFSLRDQAQHRDDDQGNGNAHRIAVADDGLPAADTIQHNYGRLLGLGSGLDIRV